MLTKKHHNISATKSNMSYRTFGIIFLVCILTTLPIRALADTSKKKTKDVPPNFSYINYHPKPSEFPQPLRPYVKVVENFPLPISIKRSESAGKANFSNLVSNVKLAMESINRAEQHRAYFLLGYVYELTANPAEAFKAYDQSIKLRTDNPMALFRQGIILLNQKDYFKARSFFQELLWRSSSATEEIHYALALCAKEQSDDEALLKHLSKSIEINSRFIPARIMLLKYYDESLSKITDPQKRSEFEANIYSNLKIIYETDPTNREMALKYAENEIRSADPLLQSGKMNKAEKIVKSLVELSNYKDTEAIVLLALISSKKGNFNKANELLATGLKVNPDSKALKEAKQQLDLEMKIKTDATSIDED